MSMKRRGMYTAKSANIRKRIARNRRRAKIGGLLYLIGVILLTAATALIPLITHELAPVSIKEFYKVFMPENLKGLKDSTTNLITAANCALYGLMLLVVIINAFRSLGKLRWLMKKRGSKAYGFNRNVFAMEDIGSYFSGSLAMMVSVCVISSLLCGELVINKMGILVFAAGLAIHFLAGFWCSKCGYYDLEKGEIVECQRLVGRFAPVVRNLLQVAAVGFIITLIDYEGLNKTIVSLTSRSGISDLLADMNGLIIFGAQMFAGLCLLVLIKHATATTEFNIDGAYGEGMKNFRIFSFFLFVGAGAAAAVKYLLLADKILDKNLLIIAGVAFVMTVVELIMRNMPKFPVETVTQQVAVDEEIVL